MIQDAGTNYGFRQPYWRGLLEVRPTRGALVLAGGAEFSQWDQFPGEGGDTPTVGDVYGDVNGLDAKVTYLHTQGDGRRSTPGRARNTRGAAATTA